MTKSFGEPADYLTADYPTAQANNKMLTAKSHNHSLGAQSTSGLDAILVGTHVKYKQTELSTKDTAVAGCKRTQCAYA